MAAINQIRLLRLFPPCDHFLEVVGPIDVVTVEKKHEIPVHGPEALGDGCQLATILEIDSLDVCVTSGTPFDDAPGIVRASISDDNLIGRATLPQNALDCLQDEALAIETIDED